MTIISDDFYADIKKLAEEIKNSQKGGDDGRGKD